MVPTQAHKVLDPSPNALIAKLDFTALQEDNKKNVSQDLSVNTALILPLLMNLMALSNVLLVTIVLKV